MRYEIWQRTMRLRPKQPSVGDVAKVARVSTKVAADILHGQARNASRTTCERVRLVAERLGHPAPPGTTLLVLQSATSDYSYMPHSLMHGIMAAVNKANCRLELVSARDDQLDNEPALRHLLRSINASGIIINYQFGFPRVLPELIERLGIPAVWLNSPQIQDCVVTADYDAAQTLTRHALELGHHRIAYMDLTSDFTVHSLHHSSLERLDGYELAMKEAGLPSRLIGVESPLTNRERLTLVSSLLQSSDRPTFIITYCRRSALPLLQMSLSHGHIRVPQDLCIATFSEGPHDVDDTNLTHMSIPWEEVGQASIARLIARCHQPGRRFDPLMLPLQLHHGQTCGPIGS
jgi:DNA-binding LacI/PurR family transcriptional regulator